MRDVTIMLIVYLPRPIRHCISEPELRCILVNVRCSCSGRLSLNIPLCQDADRRLDARANVCSLCVSVCICVVLADTHTQTPECSTVNIDGRMQKRVKRYEEHR